MLNTDSNFFFLLLVCEKGNEIRHNRLELIFISSVSAEESSPVNLKRQHFCINHKSQFLTFVFSDFIELRCPFGVCVKPVTN